MSRPRLLTIAGSPRPTVQLNGVDIPFVHMSIGYDDDDEARYGGVMVDLRFEATYDTDPAPETPEQRAERAKAEQEAALVEAVDQWATFWENRCADQPLARAVLDLHRPVAGCQRVDCAHCEQSDGMEATENVPWPCATYKALTSTPKVGDAVDFMVPAGRCRAATVVAAAPHGSADLKIPHGGTVHGVEYDSTRSTPLTWHWPCGSGWSAEADPTEPAPSMVTVNMLGSFGTEQDIAKVVRDALLRAATTNTLYKR